MASIEPKKANYISKFGYFTGGEFHSRVRTILNYYNHLGYLPDDVRKRINELKSYDAQVLGSKVPSYLKKTLMIADGELQKDLKLRKNGKGTLDLSSLPEKITIPSAEMKLNIIEEKLLERNEKVIEQSGSQDGQTTETETSPEETKPNAFLWWLLGIVGLIVVLSFLLLKGKSK